MIIRKLLVSACSLCFTITLFAQDVTFNVWEGEIPNSKKAINYKEKAEIENGRMRSVSHVSQPTIAAFLATENISNTAIVICPGGGYTHLALEKEGYKVAEWLNTLGIHAFVLKYRMPSPETMQQTAIGPLQDAQKAMRLVRAKASELNIKLDRVGVLGFSAGGHLASTLSTHYDREVYQVKSKYSARPDFSILIYPVVSMQAGVTHQGSKNALLGKEASEELIQQYSNATQIDAQTPPSFLVHATNDTAVPVENSIEYYLQLKEFDVPSEMHLYQDGGHGFGLGREGSHTQWPEALVNWLTTNAYLLKID